MNGIDGKDCWPYTYQVHKFDTTLSFFFFFFLLLQKGNGVDNRQQKQKEIKVIITTTFWTLLYRSEPSTEHDKYILSLTFFVNNHHG